MGVQALILAMTSGTNDSEIEFCSVLCILSIQHV